MVSIFHSIGISLITSVFSRTNKFNHDQDSPQKARCKKSEGRVEILWNAQHIGAKTAVESPVAGGIHDLGLSRHSTMKRPRELPQS